MRKSFIATGAAIAAASLFVASPAHAETTYGVITEAEVVHMNESNYLWGEYTPWEPEGAASFPSFVDVGEGGDYVLQGYRPVLDGVELPEGCTLGVVGFTADLSLTQRAGDAVAEVGLFTGDVSTWVEDTTFEFDGVGEPSDNNVAYLQVWPDEGELDGTFTVTLPEPIAADEPILAFVGVFTDPLFVEPGTLWELESIAFQTATTCPDDEQPAEQPEGDDELAATGPESALTLGGISLALLAVGTALGIARRRRATV